MEHHGNGRGIYIRGSAINRNNKVRVCVRVQSCIPHRCQHQRMKTRDNADEKARKQNVTAKRQSCQRKMKCTLKRHLILFVTTRVRNWILHELK